MVIRKVSSVTANIKVLQNSRINKHRPHPEGNSLANEELDGGVKFIQAVSM
jgi:hypothetical protein